MPVAMFNGMQFNFPEGASKEAMHGAISKYVESNPAAKVMQHWEDDVSPQTEAQLMSTLEFTYEGTASVSGNNKQEDFFKHIRTIETGGLDNPYIRTKVKGSGSSAYGPYQITRGLVRGALANYGNLFDENEKVALEALAERQSVALAVGGKDKARYARGGERAAQGALWAKQYGYEDVNKFLEDFDYGGSLGLADNAEFQYLYENAARKLLMRHLKDAGGDAVQAAAVWHGGPSWQTAKSKNDTLAYIARMRKLMGV